MNNNQNQQQQQMQNPFGYSNQQYQNNPQAFGNSIPQLLPNQQAPSMNSLFSTPPINQSGPGGPGFQSFPQQQQMIPQQPSYIGMNQNSMFGFPQQQPIGPQMNNPLFGYQQQVPNYNMPIFGAPVKTNGFDDDEEIQANANVEIAKQSTYDLQTNIQLKINSQYKMGKLLKSKEQFLPAMITVIAAEQETNKVKEIPQVGVDLFCLIDTSGSMQGDKIEMVKQTLKLLLNFLKDKDRLCLIRFESAAERLTPLKRCTEQNKIYFIEVIKNIQAGGGTTIGSATEIAFQQLKNRKYQNNVSSMFLLSDGQDGAAVGTITQQLETIQEPFTIHSFGFGSDHDAKMMTAICNLKSGSFYFVKEVNLLDEFFVDALGGLITVVADSIELTVRTVAKDPFENVRIKKTYGPFWEKTDEKTRVIKLPQLAAGQRKDFVFEFLLPPLNQQIQDFQRQSTVLQATIQLRSALDKSITQLQAELEITFFNEDEEVPQNEQDVEVAAQYYRVMGTEIIDDARRACEQNRNADAQKNIQAMISKIEQNKAAAPQSAQIMFDLKQAYQASAPTNFQKFGCQQMVQMASNNMQQQGLNAIFNSSGNQLCQPIGLPSYQNCAQRNMMYHVQTTKPQQKN